MTHRRMNIFRAWMLLILLARLAAPVSANSAQTSWRGTDATGALIAGEGCPILVEQEILTFDLHQFPEQHYRQVSDYLAYTGKVTAEYTFYNPADYTVDAALVFPFGAIPDYGHLEDRETGKDLLYADTEKYEITTDAAVIHRTLRHTLILWGHQFDLEEDMAQLHDGFMDDPFYAPDMPVTRLTYLPSGVDQETYRSAVAAFVLSVDPARTRVYTQDQNGGRALDGGVGLECRVHGDEPIVLHVIGEVPEPLPQWCFYENGAREKEIEGTMTLTSTETVTLKDFLLKDYDPASGVLDYDWYNAMVSSLNYFQWEHGAFHSSEIDFDLTDRLMRWYEYEITLEPGQRVVNRVTAPIYPAINSRYQPPIYTYTYLLSPARTWAGFGTLDILVNTPYHLTESSLGNFETTSHGYRLSLEGLPGGELTFTLCSQPDPALPADIGTYLLPAGAVLLAAVIAAVGLIRRRKNRK